MLNRRDSTYKSWFKRLYILVNWIYEKRWLLGISVFALLVMFKVHGVSLGSWSSVVKDTTPSYNYPTIGKSRSVRADEFSVSLPLVKAQCESPDFFPRINKQCNGGGMNMFLTTPPCPVWDWTVAGQVQNWGYFLFGFDRGMSWNWYLRYLIGFLFVLEFFLIWLKGDKILSVAAAIVITLGAPTQWWSTTIPYLNLFLFASLVFLHKLFVQTVLWQQLLAGIALFVSLSSFGFSFYPPFQIMYAICLAILAIDMVWLSSAHHTVKLRAYSILAVIFVLWALEWVYFASVNSETLHNIKNSFYPGSRIALGGSLKEILEIQSWQVISLFLPFRKPAFTNECEVCMYFIPILPLFYITAKSWKKIVKSSPAFAPLLVFTVITLCWMALKWPPAIARFTLFARIPVTRAAVVVGLIMIIMLLKACSHYFNGTKAGYRAIMGLILVHTISYAVAFVWTPRVLTYFMEGTKAKAIAMLIVAASCIIIIPLLLLRGKKILFLLAYIAVSIFTGLFVHPLSVGTSPLRDKELAQLVNAVEASNGAGMWLTSESEVAQFLIAQGLQCLNGVQQSANPKLWREIDTNNQYEHVWNRFAHISGRISETEEMYGTVVGKIRVTWFFNHDTLKQLNVKYLLWSGRKIHEPWVEYLGRSRLHFIYRIKDT